MLALTGVVLSSLFRSSIEANFDARLQVYLDSLIANVELSKQRKLSEVGNLGEVRFNLPFSGWYWQVSLDGGKDEEGLASLSLLDQRLQISARAAKTAQPNALIKSVIEGPEQQQLRIIKHQIKLVGSENDYSFIVAGNSDELEDQISDFNTALFIALSLVAAGLMIAVFIQVRFGLRPLRLLRRSLARIRSGDQERLVGNYPEEIKPLADELNALLQSNQEIIERSRTHVGNLAHALKTPLSVIMNEAQTNKSKFADKVASQAQTMREQVNLYLDRARMAARARVIGAVTEITPVVGGIARTLERIHSQRNITSEIKIAEDIKFRGEQQDLEEMLGNLLENAFIWANTKVTISAEILKSSSDASNKQLALHVDDDGPGLPPDGAEEVLKRGKRLDETKPGSGLGLSIVSELVALYEGEVKLETSPAGGLRVALILPAA